MLIVLLLIVIVVSFLVLQFNYENRKYYTKLNDYEVKTLDTDFGKLGYIDDGNGEVILVFHGIFGGYDQGYESLKSITKNNYRKICPSRFGYPESDLPINPTPQNQAKAFLELIDSLSIKSVYIASTSAGGAPAFSFAIEYPERVKGLILISSGVPTTKKTVEQMPKLMGPPKFIINDFFMWLTARYFSFIFKSMFKSDINNSVYETILPITPRRNGIINDENITNRDMSINFDYYDIYKIKAPILLLQAKDDPMVKYEETTKFISRTKIKTAIFETGGHLLTGNDNKVSDYVIDFIEETKNL